MLEKVSRSRTERSPDPPQAAPRGIAAETDPDGAPNQEWAIDFAGGVAASGRRLRIFSVVDCYTRECLTLEVDTSMPSTPEDRGLARRIHCVQIPRSDT